MFTEKPQINMRTNSILPSLGQPIYSEKCPTESSAGLCWGGMARSLSHLAGCSVCCRCRSQTWRGIFPQHLSLEKRCSPESQCLPRSSPRWGSWWHVRCLGGRPPSKADLRAKSAPSADLRYQIQPPHPQNNLGCKGKSLLLGLPPH